MFKDIKVKNVVLEFKEYKQIYEGKLLGVLENHYVGFAMDDAYV